VTRQRSTHSTDPHGLGGTAHAAEADTPVIVGIDFGGTKIAIAVADPDGRIRQQATIPTNASGGAAQAVDRAVATARALLTSATEHPTLLAAGVATPGVPSADRIDFAPNIPGWHDLALPTLIRAGLDAPHVAYGNDVKAAGTAEARWGVLRDANPGLYLNLGTGIAAALVIDGHVLPGAHGAAGEIGYNLTHPGPQPGALAGHAPLEERVGGRGLASRAAELHTAAQRHTNAQRHTGAPLDTDVPLDTAGLFASTDPPIVALIDTALDELAFHIANLAIAFDPARIAVGGGLMASAARILPRLADRLHAAVPYPPELVLSSFPSEAALHGALALAAQASQLSAADQHRYQTLDMSPTSAA
jgi:glucokinase